MVPPGDLPPERSRRRGAFKLVNILQILKARLDWRCRILYNIRTSYGKDAPMYKFKANEDILPLSEFRSNLAGYIAQTRETGRPVIVTQNGRTAGVFVNASTWDDIQEKLDKLEAFEDLLVAEGEADRGEVYSQAEVDRMMEKHIAKYTSKLPKKAAV